MSQELDVMDKKPATTDSEVKDVEIEVSDDLDLDFEHNCYTRVVSRVQNGIAEFWKAHTKEIMVGVKVIIGLAYLAYFSYCMYYRFGDEGSIRLAVCTILGVLYIVKQLIPPGKVSCLESFTSAWGGKRMFTVRTWIRRALYLLFTVGAVVYLALEVIPGNPTSLQSLFGVLFLVLISFLISLHPARINWHPVFWGIAIQFIFALLILRTTWGYSAFDWLGKRVEEFLDHALAGAEFVFGETFNDHQIAFNTMSLLIFFNSIIFLMYHLGVIQAIIGRLGSFLAYCMDTGPIESIMAAANIFVGLTEAPLIARPFLKFVTPSELHAIMTCGFASVSGGVLGMLVGFGAPANHLLSASVMSAPASLAISKVMCPETKKSVFGSGTKIDVDIGKQRNALSAIATGAVTAVKLAGNTLANLIAFVSVIKFADMTLLWFGERAGVPGLTFGFICSYILYPIPLAMGVALPDCGKLAAILGRKIFGNPVIAYIDLGAFTKNRMNLLEYQSQYNSTWSYVGDDILLHATNTTLVGGVMDVRTEVIGTYALCGFCSIIDIGIAMGTLIPSAPSRKDDIIRLVFRALVAGNIASFLTGALAGLLYDGERLI